MKRQVVKFDDIKGMLNEDEMKGVVGGVFAKVPYDEIYYGGDLGTVTIKPDQHTAGGSDGFVLMGGINYQTGYDSQGNWRNTNYNPNGPMTTTPTSLMKAGTLLAKFINGGEDFSSVVYSNDKNGVGSLTIGFGHKLTNLEIVNGTFSNRVISLEEAKSIFDKDVALAVSSVERNIHVQLTQYQFDALVSFAFQQGSSGFANSDVNTLINQDEFELAGNKLRHFSDNTIQAPGLKHRRGEEADLFFNGDYDFAGY